MFEVGFFCGCLGVDFYVVEKKIRKNAFFISSFIKKVVFLQSEKNERKTLDIKERL